MRHAQVYILGCIFVLISCQKDPDVILTTVEVSNEVFTPSYTTSIVQCNITSTNSRIDVSVLYSPSADMANAQEVTMTKEGNHYEATLTGLQDETKYFVRYKVSNKMSSLLAKQTNEFKTLTPSIPEVRVLSITNVMDSSATAEISLITDGGAEVSTYGVCWSMGETPTKDDDHCESQTLQLSYSLSSLVPNTKYYVRAYAINKKGIAYSEAKSLLTYALPCVETKAITNIQKTGCQLNGEVTFNGNDANYVEGFCWSTKSQPTLSDNCTTIAETDAIFSHNLTNLKTETTYYVRAFAKNKIGLVYGNEQTFKTKAADKPTITTSSVTNKSYTSATCGGNVTDDGGASVTERGVCYSTTSNPTTSNMVVKSGSGTGSFTCSLTGLTDGTTYYVRAYAINSKGISYGEAKTFTTTVYTKPTITTSNVTNISYTSATCGGKVTDDGGQSVTERGICYATTSNPTISNTKVTSGKGTGSFSCNLSGLTDGTTYYVRAYAKNSKGTSYGDVMTFVAKAFSKPTVSLVEITNTAYTNAATCKASIEDNGGMSISEQGIYYSTTSPASSGQKIVASSLSTSFTCSMNSLVEGGIYYVCAYAKNEKGVAYGGEEKLVTLHKSSGSGTENGYMYVNLGLSVKWASFNLKATTPEVEGGYYAWGDVSTKTYYDWEHYRYCYGSDVSGYSLTKYCTQSSFGNVDNKTTLESSDDAAYKTWGGKWRMPTEDEWIELINNCTWTWAYRNGMFGYVVKSNKNSNSIFLPGAGHAQDLDDPYWKGWYWSSLLYVNDPEGAICMFFDATFYNETSAKDRADGLTVRAVCP